MLALWSNPAQNFAPARLRRACALFAFAQVVMQRGPSRSRKNFEPQAGSKYVLGAQRVQKPDLKLAWLVEAAVNAAAALLSRCCVSAPTSCGCAQ